MVRIFKWRITGLVGLLLAAVSLGVAASYGLTEQAARFMVRATAASSLVLFLMAFTASSLQFFWPRRWSNWLLRNRRYIGAAFAFSHGVHLLFLVLLALFFPHPFIDQLAAPQLIGGGLAYGFILAMTVTSFSTPRRWLGARNWQILHTSGSYYIWFVFLQSYGPRALEATGYFPFVVALVLAVMLRLVRASKRKGLKAAGSRVGVG